jgi:hypothetical protein
MRHHDRTFDNLDADEVRRAEPNASPQDIEAERACRPQRRHRDRRPRVYDRRSACSAAAGARRRDAMGTSADRADPETARELETDLEDLMFRADVSIDRYTDALPRTARRTDRRRPRVAGGRGGGTMSPPATAGRDAAPCRGGGLAWRWRSRRQGTAPPAASAGPGPQQPFGAPQLRLLRLFPPDFLDPGPGSPACDSEPRRQRSQAAIGGQGSKAARPCNRPPTEKKGQQHVADHSDVRGQHRRRHRAHLPPDRQAGRPVPGAGQPPPPGPTDRAVGRR